MGLAGMKERPKWAKTDNGAKRPRTSSYAAPQYPVRAPAPTIARTGGYSFSAAGGKELNFVDTNISNANVSTTPQVTLLNGIVPGTGASNRVGRRVQMKSVEFKTVSFVDTASQQVYCRYALVLDRQANAAVAAFTDIYDAAVPTSLRNISNKARFKVLWDSGLIVLPGVASVTTGASMFACEHYRKIDIPVQYNAGTSGLIGDVQTNALYWIAIGNGSSGTNDSQCAGMLRIRYDDQ